MLVFPGQKYGIRGEFIPSARSVDTMLHMMQQVIDGVAEIKDLIDIGDEDVCQRGPDGRPLARMTPLVSFLTRGEWECLQKNRAKDTA